MYNYFLDGPSNAKTNGKMADCRAVWFSFFLRRYHREYLEEMKGIADGASAAGAKYDGRPIEEYDKAFKLYRGDFLPDDLYDDWASTGREQLRAQYFAALKSMARIAESSGDMVKAADAYSRLFQADESNEEACRWIMSHYLAAGDRTEALRTYERCQLALRRALDMEPEEQTKKLHRSIIGG